MNTSTAAPAVPMNDGHHGRAAFDATADVRAAVDVKVIPPYTLEALHAARQAAAIPARVEPFRVAIQEQLPRFNLVHLDRIGQYALALEYAHATLVARAQRVRLTPELAAEGYKLRALLFGYGELLALGGRFPADVLARLREGSGYDDLIEDLSALLVLYGERANTINDMSAVTPAHVARAKEVVAQLQAALVLDREIELSQTQLVGERHKIAYVLVNAHRELRRAMDYLRFYEGDAAVLVPSLYTPRRGAPTPSEPEIADVHAALHAAPRHPEDSPFTDDPS
jgi:hypothetical protein